MSYLWRGGHGQTCGGFGDEKRCEEEGLYAGAGGNKQRAPKREGQSPKGAVLRDETRRMQKTATNGNVYLGRDPEGPLAPEEGQRPYSIHPPPNGNVRVPTPETTCETFYENPF